MNRMIMVKISILKACLMSSLFLFIMLRKVHIKKKTED